MIYASLIYVIALHTMLYSRRGLLDPVSVFFLAFLYYSYLTPISLLNFGQYSVDFAGTASYVTQETIDRSAILFAWGYTGFSFGYFFLTGGWRNVGYTTSELGIWEILRDPYIRTLLTFVVFVIVVLSTFFREELSASTSSYEGKISVNYASSNYAFVINTALTLLSLIFNYIILHVRRYVAAGAAGVFLFLILAIVTFSKAPMIYGALCGFCVLYRFRRIPFLALLLGLIVGAIVMTVLFIPMFSQFRATGELHLAGLDAENVGLMLSEASGPFTIVHLALNGYISPEGHPIWHSFVLWIPRLLWPDRPLDMPEGFAQQVIFNWQIGQGLGFSPFGEAFARMGTFGSVFFMALVGGVMGSINRAFAFLLPKELRGPAIFTIGGIVSVLVLRGALSGLITQSIQNWMPVVAVSLVASEFAKQRRKRQVAPPPHAYETA